MVIAMNDIVNVTAKDMDRYRALVADIDGMSESQRDEVIKIVLLMMQASIDIAWGVHPVQLARMIADQSASQTRQDHARLQALGNAKPVDLANEGAITPNKNEELAP